MKEVCIVPSAVNEETIGRVIDETPKEEMQQRGYKAELLVIDRTREIAKEKGAKVVTELIRGKGMASRTAFKSLSCDFVFILDGLYLLRQAISLKCSRRWRG